MLIMPLSCSKKAQYRDDLSCASIIERAAEQLPIDSGYKNPGGDHIKYNFRNTELDDDHAFLVSVSSSDINEFGIFHAKDSSACGKLSDLAKDYLEEYFEEKEIFIASYAPEELEKIKNAEVKTFGNYVAYAVLSEDDRELFFDTVEKLLTK